jgi:flavin-dependent dehydrogenase
MWFAPRVRPWYGWLFPEGGDRVNIGICYSPDDPADPKQILAEVIERHVGDRIKGAEQVACECSKIVKLRGAPIVYTKEIGQITAPGALWIGEAARLTNAATGEGIFQAMKSAQIAADVISRNLNGSLATVYDKETRRYFAPRLKAALGFVRFVETPVFGWLTDLVTYRPVEKALTFALAYV